MKCSCGVWVCPAFSLQKARVDEVLKRGENVQGHDPSGTKTANLGKNGNVRETGIRLPPGMKGKENL
jgi:dual specificity phosphatase 12